MAQQTDVPDRPGRRPVVFTLDGQRVQVPNERQGTPLARLAFDGAPASAGLALDSVVRVDRVPALAAMPAYLLDGLSVDPESDATASLVRCSGLWAGQRQILPRGRHLVGRSLEADIRVVAAMVSRGHCRVEVGESTTIEDLRSLNGTSVNGTRIFAPTPIRPGDIVMIGDEILRMHGPRSFEAAALDHLFYQAAHDRRTGVWSSDFGNRSLAGELAALDRPDEPLCVALLDLDHFKSVNDTHGHEAANLVLAHVGATLQAHLPEPERASRYGGDEFLLVLPNHGEARGRARLEEIRRALEANPVELPKGSHRQTASIGATVVTGGHGLDVKAVIEAADACVYASKDAGRNRVTVRPRHGGS